MRRTYPAAEDLPESPTELIARISAEHETSLSEGTGRHRRTATTVVTRDVEPGSRSTVRRLAPLAVGASVMLVATLVVTLAQPPRNAALAGQDINTALNDTTSTVDPAGPTSGGLVSTTTSALPAPVPGTSAPAAAPKPKPAAAKPSTTTRRANGAPSSNGDGTQAATSHGWTQFGGDEFTNGLSGNWVVYEGAGHDGNGRRTEDAVKVNNGVLTISGDSNGNTGGMAWGQNQMYGKWEIRARFPKGDSQYHPVLLLWPNSGWPPEVDFAETTSASSTVSFFLHYSSSNQQKYAQQAIDLTQWHNYAVEWVDGRVTGFIDGKQWFESTDGSTIPGTSMHVAVQLDYFPDGGSPEPSQMQVDYVRIYK